MESEFKFFSGHSKNARETANLFAGEWGRRVYWDNEISIVMKNIGRLYAAAGLPPHPIYQRSRVKQNYIVSPCLHRALSLN